MTDPGSADALRKALERCRIFVAHYIKIGSTFAAGEALLKEIDTALSADAALSQPMLSDDGYYVIHFEDARVRPEFFGGYGAKAAAFKRYEALNQNWNIHLCAEVQPAALSQHGVVDADLIRKAAMIITPGAWWDGEPPNSHQQSRVDAAMEKARAILALAAPQAQVTDGNANAKALGELYLEWIKTNNLRQTDANFQAFVAGWSLRTSGIARRAIASHSAALAAGTAGLDAMADKCPHGVPGTIWCRVCTPYERPEPRQT